MPNSIPAAERDSPNSAVPRAMSWRLGPDNELALDQPRLIGVLNVTPDSFSDGGLYTDTSDAVVHALAMGEAGACMIDVGGESTRPGATRIDASEQINRVIPVIESLRSQSNCIISVDTTRAAVAEAALDAGANVINDVSAGCEEPAILRVAAERDCGLILMHRLRSPDTDSYSDQYTTQPQYANVVVTVRDFLFDAAQRAHSAGVSRANICIDPGLGFGKTVAQNYRLIRQIGMLLDTGMPVLCAASRKSFIGAASGITDPAGRVHGSVAIAVAQDLAGVRLFRVHDVAAHQQALAVVSAIAEAR